MRIKTVHYSAVLNLGNYSNERIGFTAELGESETPEQIVEALKDKVRQLGGHNADELYSKLSRGRHELNDLERKIRRAAEQWNATAEFLRAQGIKPEAPQMPEFVNLLPEVREEHTDIADGEVEFEEETTF